MSSTQIDSLDIRIESSSRDAAAAIDALIQSFEKLKAAGNFSSIEKSLKKISEATNKGLKNVPATFNKAAKAADKFSSSVKDATGNVGGLGSALGEAVGGLVQFVGNAIGIHSVADALSTTLAEAMEWEGISARFGEGFGDQVDEAYAHVLKLQDALQVNDQQFMQYSSNFATLGRGMGVPTRAIKDMSIGLTELSYDIYAKNNDFYTLEESLDAVRSAFLGEIEPIRKAGISITEATLKEAAANYGLTMSVEKMTEAQKMQLRYKVMLDQAYASSTVGTYIKEINTAEGASRALKQQLKGLVQSIGGLLMPIVSAVLPYLQAFVSLITMAIRAIGAFFGISIKAPTWGMDSFAESAGGAADAVDDTTSALGGAAKAAKKLKDYTMGFDELNVIKPQQDTSSGSSGGAGGGIGGDLGLDMDSLWTDAMIESANMKADAIVQNILTALQPIRDAIEAIDFKPLINSLKRLWTAFKPFAKKVGEGLYWFLMNVLFPLAGFTIENILPDFINLVATGLEKAVPLMERFGNWVDKNKGSILTVAGYVTAFFVAFKGVSLLAGAMGGFTKLAEVIRAVGGAITGSKAALSALTFMFNPVGNVVKVVTGAFTTFSTVLLPIIAIVTVIASTAMVLYANWDKVVQVFKNFIENIDLAGKFDAIMTALAPLMEKLAGLGDLFAVIGTIGTTVLAVAMGVVAGVFNGILTAIPYLITAVGGVIDILAGLGTFIVGIFTFDLEKVIEGLKKIGTGITNLFGGLLGAVSVYLIGFVQGVYGWFKSLWQMVEPVVKNMITAIAEWFKGLWANIKTAWAGVKEWFGQLFAAAWTNIQNAWAGVKTWFSNLWTGIKTTFSTVGTWFKTMFTTAWTNIKNAWSGVTTWFGTVWTGIKNKFASVGTWFRSIFSTAWTNIKNVFSGWASFFSGLWTKIKNTFSGLGTKLGDAIGGAVKAAINKVISWIETTVNNAITKINSVINVGRKFGLNISTIKKITIPRMASGGFVDEGQLFIAREAGAEMVGSMNNRTAVANNDQIVEGISAGVYSAVLAAMSQGGNNKTPNINVYLDGKQITAAVEKHQRERGANIMTGGVTFGY